jgi:tetratricopeptide (TPR) repeat protein
LHIIINGAITLEKAFDYLDKANKKAARFNAMQEAMAYFNEATETLNSLGNITENQKRFIALLCNQLYVFGLLLRFQEYYHLLLRYEQMAIDLNDKELLARFYSELSASELSLGHLDLALQTGTKAVDLSISVGHPEYATNALLSMAWAYVWSGEYEKLHNLKDHILNLLNRQFNLKLYVYTFCAAALSFISTGQWAKAILMGNKALKIAEEFSDNSLISHAHMHIAHAYLIRGDMIQALENCKVSLDRAPTPFDELLGQIFQAFILCRSGEAQKGIKVIEATFPVIKAINFPPSTIDAYTLLGEAYLIDAEYEKASQILNEVITLAEKFNMKLYLGKGHYFLGEIAMKIDLSSASAHFQECVEIFKNLKAEYYLAKSLFGYGRFFKMNGDIDQAHTYLSKALEIYERLEIQDEPDNVRKELAMLSWDHTQIEG